MAAADDRLIRVIGVEMEAATRENARENVASGSDPLTILTANSYPEIYFRELCHLLIEYNNFMCGMDASKRNHHKILRGGLLGLQALYNEKTVAAVKEERFETRVESRFQRSFHFSIEILGRCPRLELTSRRCR